MSSLLPCSVLSCFLIFFPPFLHCLLTSSSVLSFSLDCISSPPLSSFFPLLPLLLVFICPTLSSIHHLSPITSPFSSSLFFYLLLHQFPISPHFLSCLLLPSPFISSPPLSYPLLSSCPVVSSFTDFFSLLSSLLFLSFPFPSNFLLSSFYPLSCHLRFFPVVLSSQCPCFPIPSPLSLISASLLFPLFASFPLLLSFPLLSSCPLLFPFLLFCHFLSSPLFHSSGMLCCFVSTCSSV